MQRSCSPGCPHLKYEQNWVPSYGYENLWLFKGFYLYLKCLSQRLYSLLFWPLYIIELTKVCDWVNWGTRPWVNRNVLLPTPHMKTETKTLHFIWSFASLTGKGQEGFHGSSLGTSPSPSSFLTEAWVKHLSRRALATSLSKKRTWSFQNNGDEKRRVRDVQIML